MTVEAKPKVERHIHYVQERFWKGGSFTDLADARRQAAQWCREVAGQRVHGTTRKLPLVVFQDEEQRCLTPLAQTPYGSDQLGWIEGSDPLPQRIDVAASQVNRGEGSCTRREGRRQGFIAIADRDKDALVTAELDLDKIREVRNTWQFYRDRRPETYTGIVRQ